MAMLTRWQPNNLWSDMHQFQRQMGRLFDRCLENGNRPGLAGSYPAVNVWEDKDFIFVEAELPGLKLNDLEIYVTGGDQLAMKGTRQAAGQDKAVWHRQERAFGNFARVITLPVAVDADKVEAGFEQGVLTVRMAKSERAKPRKIAIKAE